MIFTDDRGEVEGGGVLLDTARWGRPLLKKILSKFERVLIATSTTGNESFVVQ